MARQSATTSTRAPSTGPSTEPSSCTAPTTPRGTPRRSAGQSWATIARVAGTRPPTADALHHPAGDEHRQVGGQGGDRRADDEDPEAGEQHPLPVDEVGDPADERQHGDVAEQEAGDDRGRPLQCVDADPDPAHHVGEGEHHDVGVGGGEGDGDRGRREQRPRGG